MSIFKKDGYYFCPLGGTEQIGMNLNLFGIVKDEKAEWIIVDAGVSIDKKLGISIKMADISSVANLNIIGIVCTHAHDDHIGAIPFILSQLDRKIPIYATPFTMFLVREKLKEYGVQGVLQTVDMNSTWNIGQFFNIQLIYVTHSIPEPNMVVIKCLPFNYTVLHTGDWKLDADPVLGTVTDENEFIKLGNNGVDCLICDSTNSLEEERTRNEGETIEALSRVMEIHKEKRIIFSLFASNVARLKTLFKLASQFHRKVVLLGRSLLKIFEASVTTGYLKREKFLITIDNYEQIKKFKAHELLIICTGSQGETGSVLYRLANKSHPILKMHKDDVVVFSSRVIPGNDLEIAQLKNVFAKEDINVIDSKWGMVHVSGHPSRPEIRHLLEMTKPKMVIPVHGDAVHLRGTKDVAESVGISKILLPFNGVVINLLEQKVVGEVEAGLQAIDGKQIISLDSQLLKTRKTLSENGCLFLSLDKNKKVNISTCGVLPNYITKSEKYIQDINLIIENILQKKLNNIECSKDISYHISNYVYDNYGKIPLVIVHIN